MGCLTVQRKILHYLESLSMKRADVLLGPSKIIASMVEKNIGKQVWVVESPYHQPDMKMDTTLYERNLAGKKYLLSYGSLYRLKGTDLIGDIILPLLSKYLDLHFVFIGKDFGIYEQSTMDYIRRKAESHEDRIIYFPSMPHRQLFPIIENARAVVLPSRIDNLPNTCIESMALGKIVIGTNGASFEQLIENEKSGFLCKIGDSKSLLDAIEKVLSLSKDEKSEIGELAKKRTQKLAPDIVINDLINVYNKAINNKART